MSRTPGGSPGIDRKWLPLNALRAFEAAGRHLSFTAAAASLSVAQSAVSRHVIVLETFLGAALFERPRAFGLQRLIHLSYMMTLTDIHDMVHVSY